MSTDRLFNNPSFAGFRCGRLRCGCWRNVRQGVGWWDPLVKRHQTPALTTTANAPVESATTPQPVSSAPDSLASCTAASRSPATTTRTPPGACCTAPRACLCLTRTRHGMSIRTRSAGPAAACAPRTDSRQISPKASTEPVALRVRPRSGETTPESQSRTPTPTVALVECGSGGT